MKESKVPILIVLSMVAMALLLVAIGCMIGLQWCRTRGDAPAPAARVAPTPAADCLLRMNTAAKACRARGYVDWDRKTETLVCVPRSETEPLLPVAP